MEEYNKQNYNKAFKLFSFYCFLICFCFIHSVLQVIFGFRFYTNIGWFYTLFNICVAIGGLYGYEQHKGEEWIKGISIFILPLSMLGLPCGFFSYPIWISSFYIAFTSKRSGCIKWFINSLCTIPLLILLLVSFFLPLGFESVLGADNSLEEIYSPSGKYVVVVDITDLGATGGSVYVSAGKYLNLGILGRYLPNKHLFYGGWGKIPESIEFIEDESRVTIDGVSYIIEQ